MMKRKLSNRELIRGAMLIGLGVAIPSLFHLLGISGNMFLPMHIPVILAGMLVSPGVGFFTGLIVPILCCILTGMPPLAPVPVVLFMVVELAVYGFFAGFFYKRLKWNLFVSLLLTMVMGRVFLIPWIFLLVKIGLAPAAINPLIYVWSGIVGGIVGMVIQIVIIPIIVRTVEERVSSSERFSRH